MTVTEVAKGRTASRKFLWLATGIILVAGFYSGAWFVAADQIEKRLPAYLAEKQASGLGGECTDLEVRGFPFRIGLFCDKIRLDDTRHGASASFGALRTAAQVYQPGRAIVELDGPAEIRVSPGVSVSADWTLLHASLAATLSGVDRTSIAYDNLTGTVRSPLLGKGVGFGASHGEIHLRQNGDDLDAALSVDKLDLRPEEGPSPAPPANIAADLTITGKAEWLRGATISPHMLRGAKGELRQLTLDAGSGMNAKLSGPFSVNEQGLVSGEFSLTLVNIDAWRENLVKAVPEETDLINNIANVLAALAAGKDEATVKLNVRDGTAFLAFVPIGVLPAL
ncbi:DUF2125 domain-containing protein [Sinorhizobium fredii]|uniref:DUF2125 domain-containing protein n=2 Tax=Rhizobium fredii TaxID=380 RepID=A0A844A5N5_RHIFR|nr:DUF2125 domain-containing protein [Sinorhizobium fredii]AWI58552.1 hypothetical protein AB395_00002908 [Sinorhizobium fredii CCBAU 45436]AWM26264.1 hypothetical protein AOX55_00003022 [Sinorhizobium fredii CCBAU 25509]KSV87423.1 hypothetical protein N181_18840 [Sinorhizobium fredii USDA 205]MCG5476615.1 DUF2125 domain-containing protein [Sinorhizobium fredii]MQW96678.1 DUF2125 domain-containing protein [Sinorhizobium fredii]